MEKTGSRLRDVSQSTFKTEFDENLTGVLGVESKGREGSTWRSLFDTTELIESGCRCTPVSLSHLS